MTDPSRRRTLSLKTTPPQILRAWAAVKWKCKPCGSVLQVDADLADEDAVRCPSCNARLGRAEQFRGDPSRVQGVRARLA